MMWLDLQVGILEDIGSVGVCERDRMVFERWGAWRTNRLRIRRRELRARQDFEIRVLRARESRRLAATRWGELATLPAIARFRALPRVNGGAGDWYLRRRSMQTKGQD